MVTKAHLILLVNLKGDWSVWVHPMMAHSCCLLCHSTLDSLWLTCTAVALTGVMTQFAWRMALTHQDLGVGTPWKQCISITVHVFWDVL